MKLRWRRGLPAVVIAWLCLTGGTVGAWEPETRVAMVDEAIRFMPTSLRIALETYRRDVRRGMLEPMTEEGGEAHRPPWYDGTLDVRIADAAQRLVDGVAEPVSFDELARRFGQLAHFVADAGFPPGAAGRPGAGHYAHFSEFCESRRERFRLVFLGHGELATDEGGLAALAHQALARARDEDAELARAYAAAGDPPHPSHFDDRSVPFAVGSLAYSHAINDIVRAWLIAWNEAGGDMGRTPYLERPSADGAVKDGSEDPS